MSEYIRLKEELSIIEKYRITPSEYLFLSILWLASEGADPTSVENYFNLPNEIVGSIDDLISSLQKKRIILKSYKVGKKLNLLDIPLSKDVFKTFRRRSFSMGEELFSHYPLSTVVNGVEYKLRRVSKKFSSLEEAYAFYGKAIHWKEDIHSEVISLVEYGKDSGYQFSTLDCFIVDNDWVNIRSLKEQGMLSNNFKMI